jgi:polar amino acid transport system substrate-binding protein
MRMKKTLILSLVVLIHFSFIASGQTIDRIHFSDSPYPPFTEGELGGPPTEGITLRIINEIFSRLGIETEIELMPWKRVLKSVETGQSDGVTLLMYTPEREKYLLYTEVLFESHDLIYYNTELMENFQWWGYEDLQGYIIGLVSRYTYGENFHRMAENLHLSIEIVDSSETNLKLLYLGRIDLAIENEATVHALIHVNPEWREKIRASSKPLNTYPYYMAISRRSPAADILPEINRTINEMKKDGTMERILKSFIEGHSR